MFRTKNICLGTERILKNQACKAKQESTGFCCKLITTLNNKSLNLKKVLLEFKILAIGTNTWQKHCVTVGQ